MVGGDVRVAVVRVAVAVEVAVGLRLGVGLRVNAVRVLRVSQTPVGVVPWTRGRVVRPEGIRLLCSVPVPPGVPPPGPARRLLQSGGLGVPLRRRGPEVRLVLLGQVRVQLRVVGRVGLREQL